MVPGASVSQVARQYDVNTNLVFSWRKRLGATALAALAPQMVSVVVLPDPLVTAPPTGAAEVIEIEMPRGYRVRVGGIVASVAQCQHLGGKTAVLGNQGFVQRHATTNLLGEALPLQPGKRYAGLRTG